MSPVRLRNYCIYVALFALLASIHSLSPCLVSLRFAPTILRCLQASHEASACLESKGGRGELCCHVAIAQQSGRSLSKGTDRIETPGDILIGPGPVSIPAGRAQSWGSISWRAGQKHA